MTKKLKEITITEVTGIKYNPTKNDKQVFLNISSETKEKLHDLKSKKFSMSDVMRAWTNYILSLNEEEFLDIFRKYRN